MIAKPDRRRQKPAPEPDIFVDGLPELGPPPLCAGESGADYDRLYHRLRRAVAPTDYLEEIWARHLADLAWETMRLRRLKAALLDWSVDLLRDEIRSERPLQVDRGAAPQARPGGAAPPASSDGEAKRVALLQARALIGRLDKMSTMCTIDVVERLDAMLLQGERRARELLREIDRRQDAVVARQYREALMEVAPRLVETGEA